MDTDTNGLFKNLSGTIDASFIKGADAYETYNIIYSNGEAIRGSTPDAEIINTGWLNRGTLVGPTNITFYGKSNVTDGTNFVQIYIYRRDSTGTITLQTHPFWDNPITKNYSDELGLTLGFSLQGFFDIKYDYKIVIKTDYNLASGKYVDIDYLQIIPVPTLPLMSYIANGTIDIDIHNGSVFVPGGERLQLTITGDGTSYKVDTITLNNYYGDSTVTANVYSWDFYAIPYSKPVGTSNQVEIGIRRYNGATFSSSVVVDVTIKGRVLVPNF